MKYCDMCEKPAHINTMDGENGQLHSICYLVSYGSICHYDNFTDDTSYD